MAKSVAPKKIVDPTAPRLRVSQVWRDEVMAEQIFAVPQDVSLGSRSEKDDRVTFTAPDIGLPPKFTMFRHGERGYLLTLGHGMAGEVCLGGRVQKVTDVASAADPGGGSAGSFRAVPIAAGDWGVVHLDGSGEHVVFFQFVAPEKPLPKPPLVKDDDLIIPALIFAMALCGLFLVSNWYFSTHPPTNLAFKTGDALAGILVQRPQKLPEVPEPQPQAGMDDGETQAEPASAEGAEGKSGGEGDKPRERTPDPGDTAPVDPVKNKVRQTGVLVHAGKLQRVGSAMPSDRLGMAMSRLKGPSNAGGSGYGPGKGTGVGPGEGTGTLTRGGTGGPGGGGTAHADVVTQDKITTGGTRPPKGTPGGKPLGETKVAVSFGTPEGDFDGLTKDQVRKVVEGRKTMFMACYEKELQRLPNLSGKIQIFWNIDASGKVTVSRLKSSSMGNASVESCLVRRVKDLKFPASADGRDTDVIFPFVFNPH